MLTRKNLRSQQLVLYNRKDKKPESEQKTWDYHHILQPSPEILPNFQALSITVLLSSTVFAPPTDAHLLINRERNQGVHPMGFSLGSFPVSQCESNKGTFIDWSKTDVLRAFKKCLFSTENERRNQERLPATPQLLGTMTLPTVKLVTDQIK